MGRRGPAPLDEETLRLRGAYRSHPSRDPAKTLPARDVTRDRHRVRQEERVASLAAELGKAAWRLAELTLHPHEFAKLARDFHQGRATFEVLTHVESDAWRQSVSLMSTEPPLWHLVDVIAEIPRLPGGEGTVK